MPAIEPPQVPPTEAVKPASGVTVKLVADPWATVWGVLALRQAGEIDHQRGIREPELGEVHDDVARGLQRPGERPPAPPARRAVLVARDPRIVARMKRALAEAKNQ